jgi:DNA-binding transcriptional LysR family regulator
MARAGQAGLRIVAAATAATYYLPPLWTAITRRYPGLRVQLSVENSQHVLDRLAALEDDLGVIGGTSTPPRLVLVPLVNDPLVVVVARGHPWAKRKTISITSLQGQKLIFHERGSASRALIEERLAAHSIRYEPELEIGSNEVIKRAVEIGHGIGVLSQAVVAREVRAGHLRALRFRELARATRPPPGSMSGKSVCATLTRSVQWNELPNVTRRSGASDGEISSARWRMKRMLPTPWLRAARSTTRSMSGSGSITTSSNQRLRGRHA